MYNISLNMLRNKFDAEEAVAQTFLKIIDNIEKNFCFTMSPNRTLLRYNIEERNNEYYKRT